MNIGITSSGTTFTYEEADYRIYKDENDVLLHTENDIPIKHKKLNWSDEFIKEEWFYNGYRHRLNGPAELQTLQKKVINGEYWIHGKRYRNKTDWEIEVNRIKTLNEM